MSGPAGIDAAVALLRLLPVELVRRILSLLPPLDAARLQTALERAPDTLSLEAQKSALDLFFATRRSLALAPRSSPSLDAAQSPASASPPATPANVEASKQATTELSTARSSESPEELEDVSLLERLWQTGPELLSRALEEEQPATVAFILSQLSPESAAAVVQRLSSTARSAAAKRLCQPVQVDFTLGKRLIRSVLAKARCLAEVPPVPTVNEKRRQVAAMLRKLGRTERAELLQAIGELDPAAVDEIRKAMFGYDDLTRVPDRQLQSLLTQIDMKTLAIALKGSPDSLTERILKNLPARSRQMLTDEISLLATVTKSAIQEAQSAIADLLRQNEEEGKITLD
jgi:flagellar motor switch protein FliG